MKGEPLSKTETTLRGPDDRVNQVLDALYRAFYERLVRHACWTFHLSKDDASEVVQEAFLLALEKLDSDGNPRAWIYRVVENLAANWKRKENRRERLLTYWAGRAPIEEEDASR